MNQLTRIFNGHELRIVENGTDVWFVAKDVCEILEIKNPSDALKRLDEDERARFNLGRQGLTNAVNEYGLYSLVLGSRKPEAKTFKRWITHEVIPSIRKHGAYMTPEKIEEALLNPDTIIKLATELKNEREQRIKLERLRKQDEPYTTFGKVVASSDASISIGSFAKLLYDEHGIRIGRNRLFEWLRNNGYLIKSGKDWNQPKQRFIEQGLFETTVTLIKRPGGDIESVTTMITGKGQVEIAKRLIAQYKEVI